jgi:NAD(P)-dependent dehydrogenase (short-subunit alcohol dehydrogenase family)
MGLVFLVTGSSRELGRQIVEQALASGHRVVATAREPKALDGLVAQHGELIHVEQLDVTDPHAVLAAVASGAAAFGRLDVVLSNAGPRHRLVACVRFHDRSVEILKPLMMFVNHESIIARFRYGLPNPAC